MRSGWVQRSRWLCFRRRCHGLLCLPSSKVATRRGLSAQLAQAFAARQQWWAVFRDLDLERQFRTRLRGQVNQCGGAVRCAR
jgi:hypothetical protein